MGKRGARAASADEVLTRAIDETSVCESAAARLTQPTHARSRGRGQGRGISVRTARRMLSARSRSAISQTTPYGDVLKAFEISASSGPMKVHYVCPHAWLHLVCSSSPRFGEFLVERLGHGLQGSICIYSDEVMPGNALRPDRGRQFLAIYWGIPQMPDWFRSRAGWWNTLSLVPCTALKEIEGGLSALYV